MRTNWKFKLAIAIFFLVLAFSPVYFLLGSKDGDADIDKDNWIGPEMKLRVDPIVMDFDRLCEKESTPIHFYWRGNSRVIIVNDWNPNYK